MKIVGIVAEFNPFHNGHKYIIDYARNELNADYIIIAMSGDYVQRGEPAIFNKSIRSKTALLAGADAVFMIPVTTSTASANYYALASVALLDSLGCNYLLFGSESGNIDEIASSNYLHGNIDFPNNILAREYINAIRTLKLNINAVTIKRQGSDYNDSENIIDNKCSASYIRNHFQEIFQESSNSDISDLNSTNIIPQNMYEEYKVYLKNNKAVFTDQFSDILISQLINNANNGFSQYFDVYDDLSDKIIKNISSFSSFNNFTNLLKSKDITRSHLSRALLHICLNITKSDIEKIKVLNYAPYARLLAFRRESDVLSILSKISHVDIISKLSDYINLLKNSMDHTAQLKLDLVTKDINASHLYSYHSDNSNIVNECQRKIEII